MRRGRKKEAANYGKYDKVPSPKRVPPPPPPPQTTNNNYHDAASHSKSRAPAGGRPTTNRTATPPFTAAIKSRGAPRTPKMPKLKLKLPPFIPTFFQFFMRLTVGGVKTAAVGLLFLGFNLLASSLVHSAGGGLTPYAASGIKQFALEYSLCDVAAQNTSAAGYDAGGIDIFNSSFLQLRDSKGSDDLKSALEVFNFDIYRVEVLHPSYRADASRNDSDVRIGANATLSDAHRFHEDRAVYYSMPSSVYMLSPPFLLRALTLGLLWPTVGRLAITPRNDSCTSSLFTPEAVELGLDRMMAVGAADRLADAMGRPLGRFGYRVVIDQPTWYGEPETHDWVTLDCAIEDKPSAYVPSLPLSGLEYLMCEERRVAWSKPTQYFFGLDLLLSLLFCLFWYTLLRGPYTHFADQLCEHELRDFAAEVKLYPAGSLQEAAGRRILEQFEEAEQVSTGDELEDELNDDLNKLESRPLMLVDFVVSDPLATSSILPGSRAVDINGKPLSNYPIVGDALVSVLVHWALITVVGMPLLVFAATLGCEPEDEFAVDVSAGCKPTRFTTEYVLLALQLKDAICFCYCAAHYLALDSMGGLGGALAAPIRGVAKLALKLVGLASLCYVFNVFSWMVLTIVLKPAPAVAMISLLAAPIAYAVFGLIALFAIQSAVVGSKQYEDVRHTLRKMGLRTQDILLTILVGLVLVCTLAAWVVLGYLLFTSNMDSPAAVLPALGMLGGAVGGAGGQAGQASKTLGSIQKGVGKTFKKEKQDGEERDVERGDAEHSGEEGSGEEDSDEEREGGQGG